MGGVSFYIHLMSEQAIIILVLLYLLGAWLGRRICKTMYFYHVTQFQKNVVITFATLLSWISVGIFLVAFYIATSEKRE
jgi:predicted membrane protein